MIKTHVAAATVAVGVAWGVYKVWSTQPALEIPERYNDIIIEHTTEDKEELLEDEIESDDDGCVVRDNGTRRKRRGKRGNKAFIRYWTDWGKARFPTAYLGASEADYKCIILAISRAMADHDVRQRDIARMAAIVASLVLIPSSHEITSAALLKSRMAGVMQGNLERLTVRRTWYEYLTGTKPSGYSFSKGKM